MSRGRVFLIDDHDAVLDMLRRVMRDIGVEIVGVARGGEEAIPVILSTRPDLVVLDLSMPGQSGFDIVSELRGHKLNCRFLAFTGVTSTHALDRLYDMRFEGMVSKMSRIQELTDAIEAVLAGRTYACRLLGEARKALKSHSGHPSRLLTPRELEVLAFIGEAKSNEEIAAILGISASSVQGVRAKLMHKLGLQGTPQLVRYACEHGYAEFAKRSGD